MVLGVGVVDLRYSGNRVSCFDSPLTVFVCFPALSLCTPACSLALVYQSLCFFLYFFVDDSVVHPVPPAVLNLPPWSMCLPYLFPMSSHSVLSFCITV